jgi:hypothetical protein
MFRWMCFGSILLSTLGLACTASAQVRLEGDTCSQAFANPRLESVSCQAGFRLGPEQRASLEKASYGMVSDLACGADIRFLRSEILRQARAGGEVLLPPQAVSCRLMAQGQPFRISFNVAPLVRIAKGRAVDAALGVREVRGIPEPAATLVAEVLNNDQTLRKTVVQAANDILASLPAR